MPQTFTLGLDFGTNSVRSVIVDVANGETIGSHVAEYRRGAAGILYDDADANVARQHPADYIDCMRDAIKAALAQAASRAGFAAKQIVGIGVDTTGSTPIPVDADGVALALKPEFANDPNAMAWLWKDHTAHDEAEELTGRAREMRPHYLDKCGGRYSSEWFWAKILRCIRVSPTVTRAAYTWVECADWVPAVLCGTTHPDKLRRGICAAGHKAFFNDAWGGYPDAEFLGSFHPALAALRAHLPDRVHNVSEAAGTLSKEWADATGLPAGIPVAIGAFDAHLGAVGSGVGDGTLVKIIGTSTCDIMVSPMSRKLADVPGLCGIVPESVLPDYYGLEAGQSAVGDIFNWFVQGIQPGGSDKGSHQSLTKEAEKQKAGESGLLTLDWHNGNRTVLVDQRLTGLTLGQSLRTTPAEIYRSLIESTAFGARVIVERLEEYGVPVKRIVMCGGIAARSPLSMQIYADVMNRPIGTATSLQTCALGSAIAAAVVAKAHANFADAIGAMVDDNGTVYQPIAANVAIYERLFQLYRKLHDAFGIAGHTADLSGVMKELMDLRDAQKQSA